MLNSLGAGVERIWPRLVAGENGVAPISIFDASQFRVKVAAEVPSLHGEGRIEVDSYASRRNLPDDVDPNEVRRGARLFIESAVEAYAQSGLAESGFDRTRAGVAAGFSVAFMGVELALDYYRHRRADGLDVDLDRFPLDLQPPHHFQRRIGDNAAALPARLLGFEGPQLVCDTACAASGHAIGDAFRAIRLGRADVMIAGGATAVVCQIGILYFAMLGALSRNEDPATASRPFDRGRDGFVMGEGGGALVLEDWDHAQARGATILAELAGFGMNTCALNLTDPSPDGVIEARAMQLALASAGLSPDEVDYVAAHGTSTLKNDRVEAMAIHQVFGARAASGQVLVSSNKGQLGHTISGAAVTNAVSAVMAMRSGLVPPTAHLQKLDAGIDLDCVPNQARRAPVRAALVNSFAFGGHNAVLALRAT